MKFGISKTADDGRRIWWTPSGWTDKGVSFDSVDRAQKQAERLRERGNDCVTDEAPDEWPSFEGKLLHKRRKRPDTDLVNTVAREADAAAPSVKKLTDKQMARLADEHWIDSAVPDGYIINMCLAEATDVDEPGVRQLLIHHIRAGGEKCLLRPQLWDDYVALHAEAREGLTPRYLPYELHDDDIEESHKKDLMYASGEPRMMPRPEDWEFKWPPGAGWFLVQICWGMTFGLIWHLLKAFFCVDELADGARRWWWKVTTRNMK